MTFQAGNGGQNPFADGPGTSGVVITLPDYTPPARYDGHPWTTVLIGEAGSSSGPFTTITTITLNPVDTDPSNPISRSFTTNTAQLTSGWYQVTFKDATGATVTDTPIPLPAPTGQPATPYCTVLDVQARSAIRPVTASSVPNIAQVQQFVLDTAAEINGILIKKGYLIPIVSASNPDAFATLHAINVTGAWALMEASSPTSINVDRATQAWENAKRMLADATFALNAPIDTGRSEARGPWITSQPDGHHFDPLFGQHQGGHHGNPRNPFFSRQQRF